MVLWGNKWNFGATGNMGSIKNTWNIGKNKDDMEERESRGNSEYKENLGEIRIKWGVRGMERKKENSENRKYIKHRGNEDKF